MGVGFSVAAAACWLRWVSRCSPAALPGESTCGRRAVVFNLGDSNSDTGGFAVDLDVILGKPEGRVFFGHPLDRVCDGRGRLIIDFLCENLNASYWAFRGGANFAVAGCSLLPGDPSAAVLPIRTAIFGAHRTRFSLVSSLVLYPTPKYISWGGIRRN
ncbi:hypothetical protein OPV22_004806 [Ensete ventricosum]|uniref:GDSL esterase/lipase n=1 Tax=Ensete ventricosum TaxID=4639 RepID=A0AAV8RBF8_ENSVE|nr:hypothetical protein OPV22_004806 [Ensete ventricosum]